MHRLSLVAFVAAATFACKSDKKDEPPTPSKRADAGVTKPDPAAAPAKLTIAKGSVGPLTASSRKDKASLQTALPGFQVVEESYEAEGDTYTTLFVKNGDAKVLNIDDHFSGSGLVVTVYDGSIRDAAGIGIGVTHAKLAAAYPDLACQREKFAEGETEGMGPIDSVTCTSATMAGVQWSFDILALKLAGEKLPAADKLAALAISGLSVELTTP